MVVTRMVVMTTSMVWLSREPYHTRCHDNHPCDNHTRCLDNHTILVVLTTILRQPYSLSRQPYHTRCHDNHPCDNHNRCLDNHTILVVMTTIRLTTILVV